MEVYLNSFFKYQKPKKSLLICQEREAREKNSAFILKTSQ